MMVIKIIKYLILPILIIIFIFSYYNDYNPYSEIKEYKVGDKNNLKIAIISDSQLPKNRKEARKENYKTFIDNLHKALKKIKEEKVDTIIYAGDGVDGGTNYSFHLFKSILDKYFSFDDKKSPILNIILGNHEYYPYDKNTPKKMQKRFENYLGEKPFSHKVINGIHFINWSSGCSSFDKSNTNIQWVKEQIELALKDDPTKDQKPIFVITHVNPIYTCYGSDNWGNKGIFDALKNYRNVISISGHSHYSIIDDKSIWQGQFTAIQTQCTSYIELEPGTENGSVPRDEYDNYLISTKNPMGYFVYINSNEVRFKRFSFASNDYFYPDWVYTLPINNFVYDFESRMEKTPLISWNSNHDIEISNEISVKNEKIGIIKFSQPNCETFPVKYKIIYKNLKGIEKEYLFFSDFYLMPEMRHEFIRLKIPNEIYEVKGQYEIQVWAIDTWGRLSVNNINDNIFIN